MSVEISFKIQHTSKIYSKSNFSQKSRLSKICSKSINCQEFTRKFNYYWKYTHTEMSGEKIMKSNLYYKIFQIKFCLKSTQNWMFVKNFLKIECFSEKSLISNVYRKFIWNWMFVENYFKVECLSEIHSQLHFFEKTLKFKCFLKSDWNQIFVEIHSKSFVCRKYSQNRMFVEKWLIILCLSKIHTKLNICREYFFNCNFCQNSLIIYCFPKINSKSNNCREFSINRNFCRKVTQNRILV